VTTDVATTAQQTWLSYAELAAIGALITANRRLLRKHSRALRNRANRLRQVDPLHWHTILPVVDIDVDELLRGALALFHRTAPTTGEIAKCVGEAIVLYLQTIIVARIAHDRQALAGVLIAAGCLTELTDAQPPGPLQ
jgi:hypothetical protein